MASWGTAGSVGGAGQLNMAGNGDFGDGSFTAVDVELSAPSSLELSSARASRNEMEVQSPPCYNCRQPTSVLDGGGSTAKCANIDCEVFSGSSASNNNTKANNSRNKKQQPMQQQQLVAPGQEQVPNDEDSSDDSPLLSTAGHSGRGSSDASLDGDGGDDGGGGTVAVGTAFDDEDEHCHSQATFSRMVARELRNQTVKNRLLGAVLLTAAFAAGEFAAGWYVNSTAIRTDACHMFADVATLGVSYVSARLSSKHPTSWMNYGYARTEALGALVAIAFIYAIAAFVGINALQQIIAGEYEVLSKGMMYAGACAVVFNVFLFFFLRGLGLSHSHSHGGGSKHGHSHGGGGSNIAHTRFENEGEVSRPGADQPEDPSQQLNLRAATLHALGDICASSFVLVVAVVIYFYPWLKVLDPVAAIGIALLIFKLLWSTLVDSCRIQLNAVPVGEDYEAIQSDLRSLPGVAGVHELRLFAVSTSIKSVSVHLALHQKKKAQQQQPPPPGKFTKGSVLRAATRYLRDKRGYDMVTVQVERAPRSPAAAGCQQCKPIGGQNNAVSS